jgi:hypothetical protein
MSMDKLISYKSDGIKRGVCFFFLQKEEKLSKQGSQEEH